MLLRALTVVLIAASGGAPATSAKKPDARPSFLTPREIIELLEKSDRTYSVKDAEKPVPMVRRRNADAMWPLRMKPLACAMRKVSASGKVSIDECPEDPRAAKICNDAEPQYEAKQYAEAEKQYAAALAIAPKDYQTLLNYGDAAFFQQHFDDAFTRYSKAGEVNPDDHRSWYFRGNVRLAQGNKAEAIDFYAKALALNPRHDPMRIGLEERQRTLGIQLAGDFFLPKATVALEGEAVVMRTPAQAHWIAWASCKAMWLGEPQHRVAMTGQQAHAFTSTEELECLASLLSVYASDLQKGKTEHEPELDTLLEIADAHMMTELVMYELATRVMPHALLLLDTDERARVEQFIRRFVLKASTPQ